LRYQLQASDADLGSTCPLGVSGPPARCPCAVVQYRLVEAHALEEAENIETGAANAIYPPPTELEELTRAKRDSAGASAESTAMELVRLTPTGDITPKIGNLITYRFDITLPTISDMDMKVEIFVADLDSGHTVFEIVTAAVTHQGSGVTSSAGALGSIEPTSYHNTITPTARDRVVLDLGSLTNTDQPASGSAGASLISISFGVLVIHNTQVTQGSNQYVSAGAEYNTANYVQVSQEQFTPDSTTTDIIPAFGSVTAVESSLSIAQYSAGQGAVTIGVLAPYGELYVEAYVTHSMHEDALSIGGTFVELGSAYVGAQQFSADKYKVAQVQSRSGLITRFKSVNIPFRQTGDSTSAATEPSRVANVTIPVFATEHAAVGGKATLVIFVKAKDTLSDRSLPGGVSTAIAIDVTEGAAPTGSGSLSLDSSWHEVHSSSTDVPAKSTVEYLVKAMAPSGPSVVPSADISLDTTSVTGLRACDVEVWSQGVNIIYMETSSVTLTPADGETSATITISNLVIEEITTEAVGYELVFRLSMRADTDGAPAANPGAVSLAAVNVTGTGAGAQPTVTVSASAPTTTVNIGSQFGIDMLIEYPVDDLVSDTDADFAVEFTNDLRLGYEVKFCSVHVVAVGKHIPCARAKLTDGVTVSFGKTNDSRVHEDVAITSLPLTCASAHHSQLPRDRQLKVRAVAQIMPGQTLDATDFKPGAGLEFDSSTLFAGLVDLTMADVITAYRSTDSGDPGFGLPSPGTLTYGKVHLVDIVVYIPPGGSSPTWSVTATSNTPDTFRVDRLIVRRIGRNFGCLGDRLLNADQLADGETPASYPTFAVDSSGELGSSCTIDLGPVTNVGREKLSLNRLRRHTTSRKTITSWCRRLFRRCFPPIERCRPTLPSTSSRPARRTPPLRSVPLSQVKSPSAARSRVPYRGVVSIWHSILVTEAQSTDQSRQWSM
ncbi:uncharacterized protein LOC119114529, partial [Pollicipes pollicipes]|uniref:uncharacterized protein LOC119114529 n=1 Tax=Pollicipes pollicipes TaxID=41117 RepID=UPI0018859CC6